MSFDLQYLTCGFIISPLALSTENDLGAHLQISTYPYLTGRPFVAVYQDVPLSVCLYRVNSSKDMKEKKKTNQIHRRLLTFGELVSCADGSIWVKLSELPRSPGGAESDTHNGTKNSSKRTEDPMSDSERKQSRQIPDKWGEALSRGTENPHGLETENSDENKTDHFVIKALPPKTKTLLS